MVVAHPDDETLWGGGLLARDPKIDVYVCSTPARDPHRVECFIRACAIYGARWSVWSQRDSDAKLDPYIFLNGMSQYDEIITHNAVGEYGHSHHKQVNAYIRKHFKGNIVTFGYGLGADQTHGDPLSDELLAKKIAALKCYDNLLHHSHPPRATWEWGVFLYYKGDLENLRTERYAGKLSP